MKILSQFHFLAPSDIFKKEEVCMSSDFGAKLHHSRRLNYCRKNLQFICEEMFPVAPLPSIPTSTSIHQLCRRKEKKNLELQLLQEIHQNRKLLCSILHWKKQMISFKAWKHIVWLYIPLKSKCIALDRSPTCSWKLKLVLDKS